MSAYEDRLKQYDALVDQCDGIERKGKTMPYTSDNGHMFSLLNKNGEFGIAFFEGSARALFQGIGYPPISFHTEQR